MLDAIYFVISRFCVLNIHECKSQIHCLVVFVQFLRIKKLLPNNQTKGIHSKEYIVHTHAFFVCKLGKRLITLLYVKFAVSQETP